MASLHQQFNNFNKIIRLTDNRRDSLIGSRNSIRDKIKTYFRENKPNELQPKFRPQGSLDMNTTVNPIPQYDSSGNKILKYDLDYGVYFIEKAGQNNQIHISTWHDWVYNAVKYHTNIDPKRKNTCVRVIFADGHHVDLPIYYEKNGYHPQLAHRSKGWITSNPVEFTEWFNDKAKKDQQLRRIVRYLKAWKNYREQKNTNLSLPSGFALTILAVNNFTSSSNGDDEAFRKTVKKIKNTLAVSNSFRCLRPTTPKREDVFKEYSQSRKNDFLNALDNLVKNCEKASDASNFRVASEYMQKCFGDRFPLGENITEDRKAARISGAIGVPLAKKPYGE